MAYENWGEGVWGAGVWADGVWSVVTAGTGSATAPAAQASGTGAPVIVGTGSASAPAGVAGGTGTTGSGTTNTGLVTGARSKLESGAVQWPTDDIRVRLVAVGDTAVHTGITSMAGIGLTASSTPLTGRAIQVLSALSSVRFVASPPETLLPALGSGTAVDRAVVYKHHASDALAEPLCIVPFPQRTGDGRQPLLAWDSEGLIWVNLAPVAPDTGPYPPAVYSRGSGLSSALETAKASIVRRDSTGAPSGTGVIGVLGLGMSIAEDSQPLMKEAFRYGTMNGGALAWLPSRAPGVAFQFGSDSGMVADNWANPDDPIWAYAISRCNSNYVSMSVQQVQHIYIHLTQSWPEAAGWRSGVGLVTPVGQMTADQVTDIVLNAKSKFPNLVSMDILGIPWTGASTSGQVPIAMVHDDDALLASLAGTHHGVLVDYLQVYAQHTTYNAQHTTPQFPSGLNWVTPDDYDTDNIHQSVPVGVTKLSQWILSRWIADPAKSWMWA